VLDQLFALADDRPKDALKFTGFLDKSHSQCKQRISAGKKSEARISKLETKQSNLEREFPNGWEKPKAETK
jgi:hypothetical protein